jgi:hypothetical protein
MSIQYLIDTHLNISSMRIAEQHFG